MGGLSWRTNSTTSTTTTNKVIKTSKTNGSSSHKNGGGVILTNSSSNHPLSSKASVLMLLIHECDWMEVREHLSTKKGSNELTKALEYCCFTTSNTTTTNTTTTAGATVNDKNADEEKTCAGSSLSLMIPEQTTLAGDEQSSSQQTITTVESDISQPSTSVIPTTNTTRFTRDTISTSNGGITTTLSPAETGRRRHTMNTKLGYFVVSGPISSSRYNNASNSCTTSVATNTSSTSSNATTINSSSSSSTKDSTSIDQSYDMVVSSNGAIVQWDFLKVVFKKFKKIKKKKNTKKQVTGGTSSSSPEEEEEEDKEQVLLSNIPTLLHLLCTLKAPVQMIQRVLSEKPCFIMVKNNIGQTPLHLCCRNVRQQYDNAAESTTSLSQQVMIVQRLIRHNQRLLPKLVDHEGRTALHYLCIAGGSNTTTTITSSSKQHNNKAMSECIDLLLLVFPNAVQIKDVYHKIPLDYALQEQQITTTTGGNKAPTSTTKVFDDETEQTTTSSLPTWIEQLQRTTIKAQMKN